MKKSTISHKLVEYIPEFIEEGIVYISQPYQTAIHKCCCGCGEEVVTPLTPVDWSAKIVNRKLTLYPSIGNWSFACQSHYWIRGGQVIWSSQLDSAQIDEIRQADKKLKDRYFKEVNAANNSSLFDWIAKKLEAFFNWISGK